tara:strand:- start:3476 stop:4144 length:669 start_codon:yes stop_codon:yes gene_type:complete
MSQNDYTIANQSASNARTDINNALQALASCSSGATAPSTTYANMLWYDTNTNILKMRSEADDAWISLNYLNQSANTNNILDDTQVVNTSGTQTGLLGDQSQAVWSAGSGTTESLISPAKLKGAIDAPAKSLASNGYQKFASGLVMQWGSATCGRDTSTSINWPVTFPTACLQATATYGAVASTASTDDAEVSIHTLTTTTAKIHVGAIQNSSLLVRFIAIGH